jgi:hypothetical protein
MKMIFFISLFISSLSLYAHVSDLSEAVSAPPSEAEITSNRSCFLNLEKLGCGDPGDDVAHFKSCMNNVYQDLSKNCQILMTELYKVK